MVRNEDKYMQAVQLRKRGFTLEEVAKYCDISKSTASTWLKEHAFSSSVTTQNKRRAGRENAKRLRLVNKALSGERLKRYKDAEKSAKVEFEHYKQKPLFIAGLTAYLAAGDINNSSTIRLSHTSPELHRLFIKFCVEFLGVESKSIHLWIQLYGGMSEEKAMKKWSKTTAIPYQQFYKNQVVNKNTKKTLHDGVGNTIICNTYHKHKLKTWLELAKTKW